ncbi:hypothetical protein E4U55_001821 [Claviceps digitariae]|nr:hypothetical protein E4U55_001821 [Claviceps digitariae]
MDLPSNTPRQSSSSDNKLCPLSSWSIPPAQYILLHHLPWHAVAVSALIFDAPRTRVLLVQRAGHDTRPYRWELPGGGVGDELGETILEGLAREVREETGLRVVSVRGVRPEQQQQQQQQHGQDTAQLAQVFWNSSRTKLIGRFVFEVCVAGGQSEGDAQMEVPPVVLDEREHCDFVWATEHVVRHGGLEWTGPEVRDMILEAFRLARG